METLKLNKFLLVAEVALLSWVFYLIVNDFLVLIVSSALVAFLTLPIKNFLSKKLPPVVSSFLVVLTLVAVLLLIIYFFSVELVEQIGIYANRENIDFVFNLIVSYANWLPPEVFEYVQQLRVQIGNFLFGFAVAFISALPSLTLSVFLSFFMIYFFLLDWDKIKDFALEIIPWSKKEKMAKRIGEISQKNIYGYFTIAVIEFFISLAGFYIAGVEVYLVLALLIAISAFVPFVGPLAIWLPVLLVFLLQQNFFSVGVILVTGLILSLVIDNFLSHILVGRHSKIHPLIMLLGVLGGVPLFGIFGFILGPLVMVIFFEAIKSISES